MTLAVTSPRSQGALAVADRMDALLTTFPRVRWDDRASFEARKTDLIKLILGEGGSYRDDWNGARVNLWGYAATSTSGLTGAARNWILQVRTKARFDGADLGAGSTT